MPKEGIHAKFIQSFLALARIEVGMQDDFFVAKIHASLTRLLEGFTKLELELRNSPSINVAQYSERDFLYTLDAVSETLEDLRYLGKAAVAPLLDTQKLILELKLEVLRPVEPGKKKNTETQASVISKDSNSKTTSPKTIRALNANQEKILRFLTTAQRARTKDIVDEFSSLSERTVKRNLKELLSQGFIKRRSENKAVFYSPANL